MIEATNLPSTYLEKLSLNRSFLYGESIFTSGLLSKNEIIFEQDHLSRLKQGVLKIYSQIPGVLAQFELLMEEVKEKINGVGSLYGFRITVFATADSILGQDKLFYHLKLDPLEKIENEVSALQLKLVPCHQYYESDLKMNRYGESMMERRNLPCDYHDILYYHFDEHLLEATTSNIFFIKDDVLITPSLERGILAGTMRAYLLREANKLGYKIQERRILRDELKTFDHVFLTNARRLLIPISKIDEYEYQVEKTNSLRAKLIKKLAVGE